MNRAADALVRCLVLAGGAVSRSDLDRAAREAGYSAARVDDELAALVMAGTAEFNDRTRYYRLVGRTLARKALARLEAAGPDAPPLQIVGMPDPQDKALYRMGLALRTVDRAGAELVVMAEVEIPTPGQDAEAMAYIARQLLAFGASIDKLPDRLAPRMLAPMPACMDAPTTSLGSAA